MSEERVIDDVDELLSDETRWVQGVAARDLTGGACDGDYQFARCWCLTGALDHFRTDHHFGARYRAEKALRRAIERFNGLAPRVCSDQAMRSSIQTWNDAQARTFAEVKMILAAARHDLGEPIGREEEA